MEEAKTTRARNNRKLILDVTEQLMLEEGYAAVSTRRVAKDAGLKAPLVHYYFKTTDDLFLEVYHRAVSQELEKLDSATSSEQALKVIWDTYRNSERTALAIEFMALANHRKAIGEKIATATQNAREARARMLEQLVDMDAVLPAGTSGETLSVLLIGIARTLVMEEGVGISLGHADTIAFVEWWLERLAVK